MKTLHERHHPPKPNPSKPRNYGRGRQELRATQIIAPALTFLIAKFRRHVIIQPIRQSRAKLFINLTNRRLYR